MSLQDRLDALQPRERRLLGIFVGLFVLVAVVLIPVAVSAMLAERRDQNEALQETIERLFSERDKILETRQLNERVLARYRTPAPPLAGFLDNQGKSLELEIPEFKDKPIVPIGKDYEEHATEISLKKVPMRKLVLFLEKIAQASFPTSVSRINIRKRASAEDEWDVSMTVAAYHRVATAQKPSTDPATAKTSDGKTSEPSAEDNP
jgi:type II secretory pathway component PulM